MHFKQQSPCFVPQKGYNIPFIYKIHVWICFWHGWIVDVHLYQMQHIISILFSNFLQNTKIMAKQIKQRNRKRCVSYIVYTYTLIESRWMVLRFNSLLVGELIFRKIEAKATERRVCGWLLTKRFDGLQNTRKEMNILKMQNPYMWLTSHRRIQFALQEKKEQRSVIAIYFHMIYDALPHLSRYVLCNMYGCWYHCVYLSAKTSLFSFSFSLCLSLSLVLCMILNYFQSEMYIPGNNKYFILIEYLLSHR